MSPNQRFLPRILVPSDPINLHPPSPSPSLSTSTSTSASTLASPLSLAESNTSGERVRVKTARGSMSESVQSGGSEDECPKAKALATPTLRPTVSTHLSSESVPCSTPSTSGPVTPISPESQTALSEGDPEDYPVYENTSPSGSIASTAKDGLTPRAELPQPIWPLSYVNGAETSQRRQARSKLSEEPTDFSQGEASAKNGSLKRDGSWRKKHASLDTPPASAAFASFLDMRSATPLAETPDRPSEMRPFASGGQVPGKDGHFTPRSPQARRHSEEPSAHAPTRVLAASATTGCCISAPMSPPAHYPIPMSTSSSSSSTKWTAPSSPRSTAISSASSSSSSAPDPPRWAQPSRSDQSTAKSDGDAMPDVDPELADDGEEIEVIKGTEGRIAVKATKLSYEIMVWLPGFTLDNITIATRGARTIHIVADQWDEGDHAQWDIKLGDDANMRSISAKFGGHDLKITVGREQKRKTSSRSRLGRESSVRPLKSNSTPTTPAQADAPALATPLPAEDFWASQWSPHPMTRRDPVKKSSLKTI